MKKALKTKRLQVLLNPPEPNEKLIRAMREYRGWEGRRKPSFD